MSLNLKFVFEMYCFITQMLFMITLLTVSCVGLKLVVPPQLHPGIHSYAPLYSWILQLKVESE